MMGGDPISGRWFTRSLSLILITLAQMCLPVHAQKYSVSIPSLKLTANERVVGFEIHVNSGRIARVPNIPIGWSLSIDNDASWTTSIKALVTVGAASLDAKFFRRFVVIEKNGSLGVPFSVRCDVIVTKDFKTERHIEVAPKELILEQLPNPGRASAH
ncbi:MAG: hypothetical protein ABSG60_14235 [Terracidiphilus sp.]|jgi:hypothetical protein